jgi:hypothetical protein
VVWDVEGLGGFGMEALFAAPGHVLDHEHGTVGNQDHVERGMAYNGTFAALDNTRERASKSARRDTVVCAVDEYVVV